MQITKAIEILAHQSTGSREEATARIVSELTTESDTDDVERWVYNGDFDGSETITSLQSELTEDAWCM